jgi:hypothetical protein
LADTDLFPKTLKASSSEGWWDRIGIAFHLKFLSGVGLGPSEALATSLRPALFYGI